jgi:hypothetical protein
MGGCKRKMDEKEKMENTNTGNAVITKTKKPFYKKWWFWTLAVIIIAIAASATSGGGDDETNNVPQIGEQNETVTSAPQTNTPDEKTETNEEVNAEVEQAQTETEDTSVSFGPGMKIVGEDIQPGLYRSEGQFLYWARLADFSGELNSIIANGNPSGPAIVEIKETDKGFESNGSGKWVLIDDKYQPEKLTEFGDGMYIVGKDIEPGTYKTDGGVIYWARLSNFSGELDSIIANGNPDGSAIVEIAPTDVGFETSGGGTWKKVE